MAENYPMLTSGSKGAYVKKCQELLLEKGYALPRYGADGDYGAETVAAVKQFQRDRGLEVDGICGPDTWAALLRETGAEETPAQSTPEAAGGAAEKLIAIAQAEVGYLEKATNANLDDKTANAGYNNWNKYARDIDENYPNFYNGKKNGYAWCDVFVDWCFIQAFGYANALKLLCAPEKSTGAGCGCSADFFRAAGRFFKAPKPGDQIFFGAAGNEYHTGLVSAVDGSRVYTIEGNASGSGVEANGGGVFAKSYALGAAEISGYGRPDWSLVNGEGAESPEDTTEKEEEEKDKVEIETVKKGDKGELVKSAQLLLIGRGFSCGAAGADGDFGSDTYKAVLKFQQRMALTADGEVGLNTWTRLLRG